MKTSARKHQRDRKIFLNIKIQSQKVVNIKSDNRETPYITGSAVMPGGEILLYDNTNKRKKKIDCSNVLKDRLNFDRGPWDISVVDAKTGIVTFSGSKQLQYIDVFPKLTPGRVLQLNTKCWGVCVAGDKFFTSCHNNSGEGEVRILDVDGNLLQQIGINQDGSFLFTRPYYITVSPSEKRIFVSDLDKDTVTCITMDNHVIYQYRDNEMKRPRRLYCDGGANILVCGGGSENAQVITAEGKKHCELV